MPEYTIPLMLTVKADDMSHAIVIAEGLAEAYGQEGENIYAAIAPDGYDNDGQRVYYLPGDADEDFGASAAATLSPAALVEAANEAQALND